MGEAAVHLTTTLDSETWSLVREITAAQGWRDEEAVRILLGYGMAVHLDAPPGDPLYGFGAARAELSSLRHRAFAADEAVRDLRLNRTGLLASLHQARQSLGDLQGTVERLRRQAEQAGVEVGPIPEPPPSSQDRLFAFFGRSRRKREERDG